MFVLIPFGLTFDVSILLLEALNPSHSVEWGEETSGFEQPTCTAEGCAASLPSQIGMSTHLIGL